MRPQNVLKESAWAASKFHFCAAVWRRGIHYDGRNRLSRFWSPTQRALENADKSSESGYDLLVRAGFLRQAHSGIFHLLPLGLRVQNKIEQLIDKHMIRLGASKVSLSSISSEDLWQRSGRLDKGRPSELFNLQDRKGAKYLLSPTHEEEVTNIVANAVRSYKELPLRLYQVSRKYRDEPRPRQGLLRGREFVMKDLYTFDATQEQAHETYNDVRRAYVAFLEDIGLPYLTARADSGNMGGDLSHEYHFVSPSGEDTIISCDTCAHSLNEELHVGVFHHQINAEANHTIAAQSYISKDRNILCTIYYPLKFGEPNIYAVRATFPDLDPSVERHLVTKELKDSSKAHQYFRDPRLSVDSLAKHFDISARDVGTTIQTPQVEGKPILLTKAREGDPCPSCSTGSVKLQQAVEIGHTFHLGKRYSIPLEAQVLDQNNKLVHIEMGCHGIGVSRLIGAVASLLADKNGLNWPMAISPFEIVLVAGPKTDSAALEQVYDRLAAHERSDGRLDVVIDDRNRDIGWKLKDADLVGYPFTLIVGRAWQEGKGVELACKRLGVREYVPLDGLEQRIRELSKQL